MTRLYILRHGIAEPYGTSGISDDHRRLTSKGEERVRRIGKGLLTLGLELDVIVTSPLARAHRTAHIVADELGLTDRLEISNLLRTGVEASEIRDWLRGRKETRLMIVGHNPALSDLVGLLVVGEVGRLALELKKCGLAVLRNEKRDCSHYELDWLAPPALLRRLDMKA